VIINCVTTGFARDTFDNLRNGYNKLEGDHGRIFFMDAALFYPDDEGSVFPKHCSSTTCIEWRLVPLDLDKPETGTSLGSGEISPEEKTLDERYLLSETNNSSEDIEDPGDAGPSDHGAHLYDWLSIVHDSEVTRMKEAVRVPSLNDG
jgi:hypothetical protein